jgi:hypothetical protein
LQLDRRAANLEAQQRETERHIEGGASSSTVLGSLTSAAYGIDHATGTQ